MHHLRKYTIGFFLVLCLINTASAAPIGPWNPLGKAVPDGYPTQYQQSGVLRTVSTPYRWVISGISYKLDFSVKLHHLNSKTAPSLLSFKPGVELGFSHKDKLITEIWELPPGSIPRF